MHYNVVVEDSAIKFLSKLPSDIRHQFARRIEQLKERKEGHKRLSNQFPYELWEFKLNGYRVYYVVYDRTIFISQIEYKGAISVYGVGNKNSQNQDIRFGLSHIRKKQHLS